MSSLKSESLRSYSLAANQEVLMVKDWIANAYEGRSRRQFLARMTATNEDEIFVVFGTGRTVAWRRPLWRETGEASSLRQRR